MRYKLQEIGLFNTDRSFHKMTTEVSYLV